MSLIKLKEKWVSRKDYLKAKKERKAFILANRNKECVLCGGVNALFEVHRINDGKYCYDGETVLLCSACMSNQKWFDDLFHAVMCDCRREALETMAKHIEAKKENNRFLIMKEGIIYDLNKINKIDKLKLDFLRVDYNLTRKKLRPYLCQICLLFDTCQNNFDYECVEASDFLFTPKSKTFTVKDKFLDSLIDKDNKALRG